MLSGEEIVKQIEKGNIVITPFNETQVNPNSYNLTLGEDLVVYVDSVLDCKKENKTRTIKIPDEGYTLLPGNLYLGHSNEYTETYNYVPQISGRSSIGRVGLYVHISSGLAYEGYKGVWTFSISSATPVKVYKGMQIGQIYYFPLEGSNKIKYNGSYEGEVATSPRKSRIDKNLY